MKWNYMFRKKHKLKIEILENRNIEINNENIAMV